MLVLGFDVTLLFSIKASVKTWISSSRHHTSETLKRELAFIKDVFMASEWRTSNRRWWFHQAAKWGNIMQAGRDWWGLYSDYSWKKLDTLWRRLPLLAEWPSSSRVKNHVAKVLVGCKIGLRLKKEEAWDTCQHHREAKANSSTAGRSCSAATTGCRDLLQTGRDVSNVTFHISACAPQCQNVFASGGAKEPCMHSMFTQEAKWERNVSVTRVQSQSQCRMRDPSTEVQCWQELKLLFF